MALISDPRVFVIPTFRFEEDGTFMLDSDPSRPEPHEIFDCQFIQRTPAFSSSPWRKNTAAAVVAFGPENKFRTFISSTLEEFPLFWHCELMDSYGRSATEVHYQELWSLRKSDRLAYFSFKQKFLSVALHTEGRLLEMLVYLILFELKESEYYTMRAWLESQSLKDLIAEHRKELTAMVTADLRGPSFVRQLGKKYPAVLAVSGTR